MDFKDQDATVLLKYTNVRDWILKPVVFQRKIKPQLETPDPDYAYLYVSQNIELFPAESLHAAA